MLDLIAEVSGRIALTTTTTRAAFYREAIEAMRHRKLAKPDAESLLVGRDRVLTDLAQE